MSRRELSALILGSALITLDGTATNVALPAIGTDLGMRVSQLQWVSNAPLLMLAAALLPAGALADGFGRLRVIRVGVAAFAAATLVCMLAPSGWALIAGRFAQGAGGALVLPAVLAALRGAYEDPAERTRVFGIWAAWTGVAAAAGPLLGGALVDVTSWRAVFAVTAGAGVIALGLLRGATTGPANARRRESFPVVAAGALAAILGGVAYLLIEGPDAGWNEPGILGAALLAAAATVAFVRAPGRHVLLPRELVSADNCLPANGATFAFYFGLFGVSFLLALYTQQVLGYSGLWAAVVLLPVSVMLFFAERFGRLARFFGTRSLLLGGAMLAPAGIFWLGMAPHPLPFWSRMIVGTACFGLGVSLAVSALTHAAVSAVPDVHSGAASGLNHATVRAAGLLSIALLGSIAAPGQADAVSVEGFQRALLVCGTAVALGAVASSLLVREDAPGGLQQDT